MKYKQTVGKGETFIETNLRRNFMQGCYTLKIWALIARESTLSNIIFHLAERVK